MRFTALRRFLKKPTEPDIVARAFARCFQSPDGQIVMEHLHQHSLFRVVDPRTPADELRFIEGQRQLVLWLCQMAAKGQK